MTARSTSKTDQALGRHLAKTLAKLWRRYRRCLKSCKKECTVNSVHDLRVTTRRLLSLLDLLAPLMDGGAVKKFRKKLKQRLDAFDQLRDLHVQIQFIEGNLNQFPELKEFHAELERRVGKLIKECEARVSRWKTPSLTARVKVLKREIKSCFGDSTRSRKAEEHLRGGIDEAFVILLERRRHVDPVNAKTIHMTRVAFKRFRYAIEILRPVLPSVDKRLINSMRLYQQKMGGIQDIEVLLARMDKSVLKGRLSDAPLRMFRAELAQRQLQMINAFMKSADRMNRFWETKEAAKSEAQ